MNTKRLADCQLRNDWKERIIRIGDEQTSLQNQFDNLRNDFSDNSPRIEALETNVNALDGRLIIAESDIAAAENRISACENDIDRIDAELVDKTGDINALANRVTLAEADIDSIDARVSGIETGEILLSQLVPDADKDMGGKALNNVKINANEVTVRGSQIEPTRINNDIILFDIQPDIDTESCHSSYATPIYMVNTDPALPFNKYIYVDSACWLYKAPSPMESTLPFVPIKPGSKIYVEYWYKSEGGIDDNVRAFVFFYDSSKTLINQKSVTDKPSSSIWAKSQQIFTPPGNASYLKIACLLNNSAAKGKVSMAGLKYWTDANFDSDLQAKVATFDGVIIQDGGTVDGVDISAHTHDGTAVGGAKITSVGDLTFTGHLLKDSALQLLTTSRDPQLLYAKGIKVSGSYTGISTMPGVIEAEQYRSSGGYILNDGNKLTPPGGLETIGPVIGASVSASGAITGASVSAATINGATINTTKTAEWDGKADGSIFTPAKAAEWDGKQDKLITFPSDFIRASHDAEASTLMPHTDGMALLKKFTFSAKGITNCRVKFDMRGTSGTSAYAEVRKNGSLIGTDFIQSGADYVTKTQDLNLNISAGDTIELWAATSSVAGSAKVRNFRICYDFGISGDYTIS